MSKTLILSHILMSEWQETNLSGLVWVDSI